MKLAILATFLFIAAVAALPVEEIREHENLAAVHGPPGHEDEEPQPADDLKTDATFWGGGWGGYRSYGGYGGWGGYYNPYYTGGYYHHYPTYYRTIHYW